MNHLPFTLTAYFFNATSVTIDKFLLTKSVSNPLTYIFYISLFSLLALLLLPFTHIPGPLVLTLASSSSFLWTIGAYFMFTALQVGQPARVIPIIGTLTPLFLLTESVITRTITEQQVIAVIILLSGLVFLTIIDWKGNFKKRELFQEILSALFFAASYIVLRQAYLHDQFLTVFVWSKWIIVLFVVTTWLIPATNRIIHASSGGQPQFKIFSKPGMLFLAGQGSGGASELLLTYSISLANPALVNSLQGTQYAFLFIFSALLSRRFPEVFNEHFTPLRIAFKIFGLAFIAVGLYLLAANL